MEFNQNPQPTTLMLKTNTPFKYPCEQRYINFDYQVTLSGNITLDLLSDLLKAWQGTVVENGIGTTIKSFQIHLQPFQDGDNFGRIARGCVVSNIQVKHTANEFVQVDVTFMCKSVSDLSNISAFFVTPPTTTCQEYLRNVTITTNVYPYLLSNTVFPGFNLSFQTEWADKLLTHTNSILTTPIWTTKNIALSIDFMVPSNVASTSVGTVYLYSQNSSVQAYQIIFKKNVTNFIKIQVYDVRLSAISLPDPEKGIWQGNATYQIVSGIDEKYNSDLMAIELVTT